MAARVRAFINEHLGPSNSNTRPVFFPPGAAGVMQLRRALENGNINRIRRIRSAMISSGNFNPSDWNGLAEGPAYRAITGLPLEGDNAATRARLERERNNLRAQLRRRAARQRRNSNNNFLNPNYLNQIRRNNAAFFSSRQPNNSNGERTPPARARRNNAARSPGAPRRVRPRVSIPIPGYNNFRFSNNNRPYNMFPPNYTGPMYGNNVIGLRANEPAVQAPNYSKASKYLKKWLEARPHEIRLNQVLVKLPPNASDPISLKNFNKGNEAIMVLKKDVRNGKLRSKRYFLEKNVLARLARKPWRSILRMKASDSVFKDPINRRTVYRRNLMNVKFV